MKNENKARNLHANICARAFKLIYGPGRSCAFKKVRPNNENRIHGNGHKYTDFGKMSKIKQ